MADPLSMVASVIGVAGLAISTSRALISLIQEMTDAPQEILHIRRDVQNLSAVLGSLQDICAKYDLKSGDLALESSLTECINLCQDSMQSIHILIAPLKGSSRRSPIRMIGWVIRKGEIKALRERLQEGKTSLNITISVINGFLEGKGQDEIKSDVRKVYEKLSIELRSRDSGKRVRKRMEDDVASVSAFGGRRQSISQSTDAAFVLDRYFDQLPGPSKPASPLDYQSGSQTSSEVLLSPFSAEPITLLDAVRARNSDGVIRLISSGYPTDERTQDGQTVLHFCAIYNDAEIAQLLLNHGADINARDNQLRSPLNVALSSEALTVANVLVQRGCSLTGSTDMIFPLTQRIEEIPVIRPLLKSLAPKFNKSASGPYLVHQALETNDLRSLEILLSAGFDPNIRDKYGLPPLYQAMMQQQKEAVRLLLTHGANKNDYLPPETEDKLDESIRSHQKMATFFSNGYVPLEIAARVLRDVEMTRILLESGANINYVYPGDGGVVLSGLGDEEYFECAKVLIDSGADMHIKADNGRDPFLWANACSNTKLADYMLSHGADVNHFYYDDYPTALFLCVDWDSRENAEVLVKHGADLTIRNKSGETVLDIARSAQHHEMVAILERAVQLKPDSTTQ
ncbi:ankyrin [Daldinia decipiens]|uniref:ankyrin n=1 Tax=Daldinia decipiens TaxID=326647 RepID=UPI0020C46158|nr:ankyrin [Daldinia decipiens]KAI1655548.1 ankyrin [Daldinia decipiens]